MFHDCLRFWEKGFKCYLHEEAVESDDDDDDRDLPLVGVPGRDRTPLAEEAKAVVGLPTTVNVPIGWPGWPELPPIGAPAPVPDRERVRVVQGPDIMVFSEGNPNIWSWPRLPQQTYALGDLSPWKIIDATALPDEKEIDFTNPAQDFGTQIPYVGERPPLQTLQPAYARVSEQLQDRPRLRLTYGISERDLEMSEALYAQQLQPSMALLEKLEDQQEQDPSSMNTRLRMNDLMWPAIGAGAVLAGGLAIRSGGFGGRVRNFSRYFQGLASGGPIEGF